jgi:type 1 glutamine amidotransferase
MSMGWHHESVSDALATLYQLGKETGLWETHIRTDVGAITKKKLEANAKNLDWFDAVFFMTTGELPLDDQQKADLLSFVREGKGFLGAHNAIDTLYKWPEYGEMIGGYFDGHPWNQVLATINVEDRQFAATRHFPASFQITDEIYQVRNFSRERHHVLMSLDLSKMDMSAKGVKHKDIPIAWMAEYGKGRVFYSGLGHRPEVWDRPDIRKMWVEAVKWAMGIAAAPQP